METVVVDDKCQSDVTASNIVIDLDEECNDDVVEVVDIEENENRQCTDRAYNQLEIFEDFLQRCFTLDCSSAMLRVVNRTLIPLYKRNESRFQSDADAETFTNALTRALNNIKFDPLHRFSHVKELCEVLKYLKNKVKVPVTKNKKKLKGSNKRMRFTRKKQRKKPRIDGNIINIDDDEFEVPIVNLDVVNIEVGADEKENSRSNNVAGSQVNVRADKHYIEIEIPNANSYLSHVINDNTPDYVETVSSSTDYLSETTLLYSSGVNQNITNVNIQCNDGLLQVTRTGPLQLAGNFPSGYVETANRSTAPVSKDLTESEIVKQIGIYKKLVDQFNVQEVNEDSQFSPYIQCEFFQRKIVELYDLLCRLKGRPSVKQRKVRLRAIDSRPELPMKKLEILINSNIGKDGLPHFPDLEEVVDCVREANNEGNLGWDSKRIMTEARALFVHCGRALQSKRQKREWRDLMSLVKDKSLEDPADKDPILAARLHMNKLFGKSKESDIFEKYSSLEDNSLKPMQEKEATTDCLTAENQTNSITTENDNNHTTTNGDVTQIRIESISSGNEVVTNKSLNNVGESCDPSSSSRQTEKEMHNDSNIRRAASINTEIALADNFNKNSSDIVNKNVNEQSEDITLLNSKKSSNIQVVSIETFDDSDTNNNEGQTTNTQDYSKDENCNRKSGNVNDLNFTQIYIVNYGSLVNMPLDSSKSNVETCSIENTSTIPAPSTTVKETSNVLEIKRKTDGGAVITCQSEGNKVTNRDNVEINLYNREMDSALVKSENTIRELNELGRDFTVNILSVIDPFLIIEVSSDSSSEDDDDEQNVGANMSKASKQDGQNVK